MKIETLIEERKQVERKLQIWERRIEAAIAMIVKGDKVKRDCEKRLAQLTRLINQKQADRKAPAPMQVATPAPAPSPPRGEPPAAPPASAVDDGVPEFLRREQVVQRIKEADAAEKAKFKAQVEENKRARAAARAAKRNAIARGDTGRMPLSGRAALRYIDGA